MNSNLKRILVAGTAIVAVSAFSSQAKAADLTMTGSDTWALASGSGGVEAAAAGDNVNLVSYTLTVTNDGTADDGSANKNTFSLGAVTGTTGVITVDAADDEGNLIVDIDSITLSGAGAVNVTNSDATSGYTNTVTVSGDIDAASAAVNVTAGGEDDSDSTLVVRGDADIGALTVAGTAGGGAGAAATASFAGDLTSTGITLTTATGTANLVLNGSDDQTVTGAIGGSGVVSVTNTSTGTVTFANAVVGSDVAINTTADVNFMGVVTADITLYSNTEVTVGGILTGDVIADTDGYGALTLAATTFLGNVGSSTDYLGTLEITGNVTSATGDIYADHISVRANDLIATAGDVTISAGGTLSVIADTASTSGTVTAGGTATLASGSSILVSASYSVAAADEYTVVTGATLSSNATIVSNVPGFTFVTTNSDATHVVLTAVAKTASEWTEGEYAHKAVNDGVTSGGASVAKLTTLQNALNNVSSEAERDALLEAAAPTVDGSSVATIVDGVAQVQGVADTRMAALRIGDVKGIAAGNGTMSRRFWMQGYYTNADQDIRDGVDGYQSDTAGVMFGVDSESLVPNAVVGVAVNYGSTSADSENASYTDTDIDSYGLTVYGSMDLSSNMFGEAQLGYGYNDVDTIRHDCGGAGLVCNGSTSSDQYSAKVAVGREFQGRKGMKVTPKAYASYARVETDGYTETGTGTDLQVEDVSTVESLDLGVDLTAAWEVQARDGIMQPSVTMGYAYDAMGDAVETTAAFAGITNATSFVTTGADPAKSKFKAGVGFVYETDADWDVAAKYDAVFKEDYFSHNGSVRFTTHF